MPEKKKTIRVRMRGNHRQYDNGKTYEMTEAEANELTGLGIAVIEAAAPAEED
ncbi:MAG: hypothetical protein AB7T74_02310 [Clostridia bacterium]